ncbi:hypothetical protein EI94DRAFT_1696120 [Lactarius quietus]|nr:hypothetical protein EI94DRAFT_1696120 [Lactarius quietus]
MDGVSSGPNEGQQFHAISDEGPGVRPKRTVEIGGEAPTAETTFWQRGGGVEGVWLRSPSDWKIRGHKDTPRVKGEGKRSAACQTAIKNPGGRQGCRQAWEKGGMEAGRVWEWMGGIGPQDWSRLYTIDNTAEFFHSPKRRAGSGRGPDQSTKGCPTPKDQLHVHGVWPLGPIEQKCPAPDPGTRDVGLVQKRGEGSAAKAAQRGGGICRGGGRPHP